MTMYRYMTLTWSVTDRSAARRAKSLGSTLHQISTHKWSRAWAGSGLAIYHSGEQKGRMQSYCLKGERGAVLGRLFRSDYKSIIDDFDELESRKCLESRGQHLIDNYWGRYVAFLNDPATSAQYILRDPSGAFPCFLTHFRGVTIYFSDIQDAANFDFLPFTVNWDCLKSTMLFRQYQKTHTGLNEVSEVLPAECVEVTPFERKSRFVWNPTEISQVDVVVDPEEAAVLLRQTVKNTIGALVGCYDRIVHNLGGLDSSIALACMAQAPKRPEIVCATNFTNSPRGEERRYSRQAAEMYDVELVEWELDYQKADLSQIFTSNMLVSPLGFFDCQGLTGDVLTLAKERQARALFYGVGGDQVYYQPPFNLGGLDYARQHSLFRQDALRIAMEASRYGRKSLFATVSDMIREQVSPPSCFAYVRNTIQQEIKTPLVSREFLDEDGAEEFLHPLLIPDDRDPKGKYLHILICALFSIEYYDHWDTEYYAPREHVYLTQPIVEMCLRIPTWIMTYGGVDRGLARKAFRNDLPPDVVNRFSKSTPRDYYEGIFKQNKELLRSILLDGVMVREGVLLRDKVAHAFTGQDRFLQVKAHEVLKYVSMEVWLRRWMERPAPQQSEKLRIAVD